MTWTFRPVNIIFLFCRPLLALAVWVPFPAPPPPCDFDLYCLSGLSRASVATERSHFFFSFPVSTWCVCSKQALDTLDSHAGFIGELHSLYALFIILYRIVLCCMSPPPCPSGRRLRRWYRKMKRRSITSSLPQSSLGHYKYVFVFQRYGFRRYEAHLK
jgi:hypothetical protein